MCPTWRANSDHTFRKLDLMQLENYRVYLKLMIDGVPSLPFSARTLQVDALSGLGRADPLLEPARGSRE